MLGVCVFSIFKKKRQVKKATTLTFYDYLEQQRSSVEYEKLSEAGKSLFDFFECPEKWHNFVTSKQKKVEKLYSYKEEETGSRVLLICHDPDIAYDVAMFVDNSNAPKQEQTTTTGRGFWIYEPTFQQFSKWESDYLATIFNKVLDKRNSMILDSNKSNYLSRKDLEDMIEELIRSGDPALLLTSSNSRIRELCELYAVDKIKKEAK